MKEVETWKGWYKYRVWLSPQLPLTLSTTETIQSLQLLQSTGKIDRGWQQSVNMNTFI